MPQLVATSERRAQVLCIRRVQVKVVDTVVRPITVDVVDDFFRFEESTETPLHHKPVQADVASFRGSRVVRRLGEDVPVLVDHETPVPEWVSFCPRFRRQSVDSEVFEPGADRLI